MKRLPLDVYDPKVYPRKLWVCNEVEGLDKVFVFMRTDDPDKENPNGYKSILETDNSVMCTCPVMRISDGKLGVLVIAMDMETVNTESIAHESVHVADYFYNQLDLVSQDFRDGNEAYAYLVGWAAGCISSSMVKYNKEETL